MATPDIDVAIVGGGIVGATLAAALAQRDFRVALIEAERPPAFDPAADYDLRLSAIASGPARVLDKIGAWRHIAAGRLCRFGGMKVWEADSERALYLEHTAIGAPQLGHIVENRLIVDSAWRELGSTRLFCPARLARLDQDAEMAHLALDTGEQVRAALVVGAEGANSPVRRAAGIATTGWSYGQRCTVGAVTPAQNHRHIAWQRFTETGPVAFLPLADGRCSLAWHADDALAAELAETDDAAFCERLTAASGGVLGRIERIDSRAAFPLRLLHAHRYFDRRVALVGDAAHVIHPMAGQGVNLGLLDVAELVAALEAGRDRGADPAAARYLRRYQRARMSDNLAMMAATDALKRAFGSRRSLLRHARVGAIAVAGALAPIRQIMLHQAAGASHTGAELLTQRFGTER